MKKLILFNKKIRKQNEKMFKIVLIIFLFLNVFLMLFLVYFKIFLLKTKNENLELNKKINDLLFKNSIYNYQNNYRMINILSSANIFFCASTTNLKLSFVIKNINEFSLIKPLLKIDQKKLHLIPFYQYSTDGYKRNKILFFYNFLILIETFNNNRFGFINNKVENEYLIYFFSFNLLKIFKPLKKDVNYNNYKEGNILLKIGDKDLIIYENFNSTDNGGYSEYKNFESFDNLENPLIGINGFFSIKEMEIFLFVYT